MSRHTASEGRAFKTSGPVEFAFRGALVPLAVAVVGCNSGTDVLDPPDGGSEDASSEADGDASETPERWTIDDVREMYCERLVDARCDAYRTCGCEGELSSYCTGGDDVPTCVETFRSIRAPDLEYWDAIRLLRLLSEWVEYYSGCTSIEVGYQRTEFYGAQVRPAMLGEACDPVELPTACANGDGVCLSGECVPMPEAGESCMSSEGQLPCQLPALCADGTCVVPGDPGDSCTEDVACEAPARCVEGSCHVLGGPDGPGSPCTTDQQCAPNYGCVRGSCAPPFTCADGCGYEATCVSDEEGSCRRASGAGDPCAPSDPMSCEPGLACDPDSFTCVTAPAPGEPCISRRCLEGAFCAPDGTCRAQADVGEPCSGSLQCRDSYCDTVTGECETPKAEGEPCDSGSECEFETSFCDSSTGRCAARLGIGEPCDPLECATDLVCNSGTCASPSSASCDPRGGSAECDFLWCASGGVHECRCSIR